MSFFPFYLIFCVPLSLLLPRLSHFFCFLAPKENRNVSFPLGKRQIMVHYCELMKDALKHPGNPCKLFTGCCKYDPESPVHQKVGQCMAWMLYISFCFDGSALVYCWVTANVIWLTGTRRTVFFFFCSLYPPSSTFSPYPLPPSRLSPCVRNTLFRHLLVRDRAAVFVLRRLLHCQLHEAGHVHHVAHGDGVVGLHPLRDRPLLRARPEGRKFEVLLRNCRLLFLPVVPPGLSYHLLLPKRARAPQLSLRASEEITFFLCGVFFLPPRLDKTHGTKQNISPPPPPPLVSTLLYYKTFFLILFPFSPRSIIH